MIYMFIYVYTYIHTYIHIYIYIYIYKIGNIIYVHSNWKLFQLGEHRWTWISLCKWNKPDIYSKKKSTLSELANSYLSLLKTPNSSQLYLLSKGKVSCLQVQPGHCLLVTTTVSINFLNWFISISFSLLF